MTVRSVVGVLFVVMVLAVSAIELSTWLLGRAMSAIVPAASVSEVNAEIDTPEPVAAPKLTW
jgi:hypothetical protein